MLTMFLRFVRGVYHGWLVWFFTPHINEASFMQWRDTGIAGVPNIAGW